MKINPNEKIDSDKLEKFVNSDPDLGKFWKERIEKLIDIRDKLIDESDIPFGELILDRRNGELGLVLGAFDPQLDGRRGEKTTTSKDPNDLLSALSGLLDTTPTRYTRSSAKITKDTSVNQEQYYLVITPGDKVDAAYSLSKRRQKGECSPQLTKEINDLPDFIPYNGCRCRYVKRKYIQKLDLLVDSKTSMGSLKDFCHNQCIMDCSKDCVLHKFGCYPKDN